MQIEKLKVSSLKPYENNAKLHPQEQIEQIIASIKECGFNDPIAVDENNVIIEGHGRYLALKQMGIDEVECIRLSHLSEEQKKAYILIHNKLTMNTGFDMPILEMELLDIESIDMTDFGFSMELKLDDDGYYGDERKRTDKAYNLDLAHQSDLTNDFWQMPIIKNDNYIPQDLIGFNYAKTSKDKNVGVHFFIDDYQFERVWNAPEKYISDSNPNGDGFSHSQNLNYKLDNGIPLNPTEQFINDNIQAGMHDIGKDSNLVRYCHDDILQSAGIKDYTKLTDSQLQSQLVGKTFKTTSYMSTSYDGSKNPFNPSAPKGGGREVVMNIKAGKNTKVVFGAKKQAEFVLNRGTNMRITGIHYDGTYATPRGSGTKPRVVLDVETF